MTKFSMTQTVVAIACAVCSAVAFAQAAAKPPAPPAGKSYRIGVLGQGNPPTDRIPAADLRQGLKDWGYEDGRNVVVELRYGSGDAGKLPELAKELVLMKVDVIVTIGDAAALAAKGATTTIPVVATEFGVDPVKTGLVSNLGRPTGNVTGLSTISDELWGKRIGLLRELVPRLARVGVFWNPGTTGDAACLAEIRSSAATMNMQVVPLEVTDANSIERAFSILGKDKPDALALCWNSVTLEYAHAIADLAIKRRLPTVAPLREYVKAGALLSFGVSLAAHRRRAAYYTDKIIKGTKPADLPVERPTHFELVMNLATAKVLGIAIPPSIGLLADEIVE